MEIHAIAKRKYIHCPLSSKLYLSVCVCVSVYPTFSLPTNLSICAEMLFSLSDCVSVPFLHLHEFIKGLYFHCSLCGCVCLSVNVSVNKIPTELMHWFDSVFTKWLLTTLAQTLFKSVTLDQKLRSLWPKNCDGRSLYQNLVHICSVIYLRAMSIFK